MNTSDDLARQDHEARDGALVLGLCRRTVGDDDARGVATAVFAEAATTEAFDGLVGPERTDQLVALATDRILASGAIAAENPFDTVASCAERLRVARELRELPDDARRVVWGHLGESLDVAEVAERTGQRPEQVTATLEPVVARLSNMVRGEPSTAEVDRLRGVVQAVTADDALDAGDEPDDSFWSDVAAAAAPGDAPSSGARSGGAASPGAPSRVEPFAPGSAEPTATAEVSDAATSSPGPLTEAKGLGPPAFTIGDLGPEPVASDQLVGDRDARHQPARNGEPRVDPASRTGRPAGSAASIGTGRRALVALGLLLFAVIVGALVLIDGGDIDDPDAAVLEATGRLTNDALEVPYAGTGSVDLFANDGGHEVVIDLVADDFGIDALERPNPGETLEVWIAGRAGTPRHSLGDFTGDGTYQYPEGIDPAEFPMVDISVEPPDDQPGYGGVSVLRSVFELE